MSEHENTNKDENAEAAYELTASGGFADQLEKISEKAFGKPLEELTHTEASQLLMGITQSVTERGMGRVTDEDGHVVLEAKEDGEEAVAGYGRQLAKEMTPRIDDDREIIIKFLGKASFIDTFRGREPKVERTLHYKNEPPTYV